MEYGERKEKERKEKKEKKKKQYTPLDPKDPQYATKRSAFKIKISEIILRRLKKYHHAKRIATKVSFCMPRAPLTLL